ncbi:MAG: serine hydrolase [Gemmatimonadales bacterium]
MRILCLAAVTALTIHPLAGQAPPALAEALRARIARDTAEVSIAYYDPVRRDSVLIDGLRRFHAASTMKVPVLVELSRRIRQEELHWDQRLRVENRFVSIVDGSPYQLDLADDSDSTLYARIGDEVSVAQLTRLMICRSSNLATNILISQLDPARVTLTAHEFGADSLLVLRGVEDGKAYERGLNNTTTATDLAVLMLAIAQGRAGGRSESDSMRQMLLDQEFNDGIPAGIPVGVPVAHKTGWITALLHDAAIVYPPGRGPYVLVVLTRGLPSEPEAARLIADLSAIAYRWATRRPDPRE